MANNVKFYFGQQSKYDALIEKNPIALYFIEDTQRLYKGDTLLATGANVTETAAGLLSAEDYVELKKLIATGPAKTLVPVDGSILVEDDKIGVKLSAVEGNLMSVKDDGLFVAVDSLPIDKIVGLADKLDSIEKSLIGGIHYKGSVDTVEDLPTDAAQGDLYEVLADNSEWCFNGEEWFEYGHTVDFSPIAGTGIEVDGRKVSVKISENSNGLVAVDGAMTINLATPNSAGAMSAEDKAFLNNIPSTYATVDRVQKTAMQVKYEISNTPEGTLINYGEKEIRIMCPSNAEFAKQTVGIGGDPNCYYITFKTYAPNNNVVGYIEHLGDKVDSEILTNFSIDEYGRRYQPTWLALAKYDETSGVWTYYGDNSTENKYIGWNYQIDWYDTNGVMIASDSIRINLSNENCHSTIEPYYMSGYATVEQMSTLEESIATMNDSYTWGEI